VKLNLLMLLLTLSLGACSIAPDKPVTREDLMKTRIYNYYVIEESPEQVLKALNTNGEVILESKRNVPGKSYPVHIKLLATSDGLEVVDYDR